MILTIKEMYIFIVSAILLNSVMGTLAFSFWKQLEPVLERRGMIRTCSVFLRVIVLLFIIPVSIAFLWLFLYDCELFSVTPALEKIFFVIGILWLIGFVRVLVCTIKMQGQWKKLLQASCECEKSVEELKEQCKKELQMAREIEVRESYKVPVPLVFGVRHPMILLPAKEYTREELKVIFFHELMHCKHHDLFWKRACGMINMIFWWNPWIVQLKKYMDSWNETYCDFSCIDMLESKKKYFYIICNIGISSFSRKFYFCAALCEEKDQIKTRILRVKAIPKQKKVNVKMMARMSICLFVIVISTMFLNAIGYKQIYTKAVYATNEEVQLSEEETQIKMKLKEYHDPSKKGRVSSVVRTETNPSIGEEISFVQNACANTRMETDPLHLKRGTKVQILAMNSEINSKNKEEKTLIAGIKDSNGKERKVMHLNTIEHTFYISESGEYKIFVENRGSRKEEIGMTFYIKEK